MAKQRQIIFETKRQEIHVNSISSAKMSYYIDHDSSYNVLVIPYSSNLYVIMSKSIDDPKKRRSISHINETFDIKIPKEF